MTTTTDTTETQANAAWGGFGDIVFRGNFSPSDLNDNRQFALNAIDVANGYPLHQFTGEKERTRTLNITLHNRFCNIADSKRELERIAESGIPEPLVIGTKVHGNYGIKSIAESQLVTTTGGVIISATYAVTIVEVR